MKWRPAHAPEHKPETESDIREYEVDVVRSDGRTMYKIDQASPQALVIHCGDPRFQTAFRRFVTEELGIKSYTPLVIGGGAHSFGVRKFLPKNFKILWEQVKFFVKAQGLKQVIVINHEDCKWYESLKGYHPTIGPRDKGMHDLKEASLTILEDFAGLSVRKFWAALEGDSVYFVEL
jgi:hypothetical protein